ncbi:MAG TPA: hypothetical protein VM101_01280 [Flavitalea sp.]|nr:hypothetical protein [Flavitalea sp.]
MMRYFLTLVASFIFIGAFTQNNRYIQVSKTNHAYFAFSDGTTYIPVGINMINPSGRYSANPDSAFYEIGLWMKNLSANGGNYIRVWLSNSFWDIEEKAGVYNEQKALRIDSFIEMARSNHLKIKMTLEHFRSITNEENPQPWATKSAYHTSNGGPLDSIVQYLTSEEGHLLFLNKIDYYKKRYGSDTLFFGWELWNEMNAMKVPEDSVFYKWNEKMLDAVKQRFPQNLVMQSLGSFDGDYARPVYEKLMTMPGNEVAQVHRYLDEGAKMEVCHAPMDIICSSAFKDIKAYHPGKPIILAETGAVQPNHAGPSIYYPKDTAGILLHDILFAPFFSGSAAPGMSWHWESYVDRNNLWFHFGRFNEAIKGIDPVQEFFIPAALETGYVRMYILKGKRTTLVWVRDKNSNWQSELENNIAAPELKNIKIALHDLDINTTANNITMYDPWKNKWTKLKTGSTIHLPPFKRSVIIRLTY